MGSQFHIKKTEVTTVENGKTQTKRTADQMIEMPSWLLLLALTAIGTAFVIQDEWLIRAIAWLRQLVP